MNKAILIGRVGSDVTLVKTEKATVARLNLATNERYKKGGDVVEETTWHRLVFFGKAAEIINEKAEKGRLMSVTGKIKNKSYEKDGQTKYVTEIHVREFLFLSASKNKPEAQPEIVEEEEPNLPY